MYNLIYAVIAVINDGFVKRLKVKNYQEKQTYLYLTCTALF